MSSLPPAPTAPTIQVFERPPYSGRILQWGNCGEDSEHTAITLSVAPEDRECVIVAQIGGCFRTQSDEESIQHVLDTLETDCSKIGCAPTNDRRVETLFTYNAFPYGTNLVEDG